jgi:hypothetical protein
MAARQHARAVGVDAVNLLRLLRCAEQLACVPQLDRERFAAYLAELHALYRRVDLSAGEALSAAHGDDCRRRIRSLDELLRTETPMHQSEAVQSAPVSSAPAARATPLALASGVEPAPAELRAADAPVDSAAADGAPRRRRAGLVVGEEASTSELAQIEAQRRAHDALLDETSGMVSRLKHNALLAQQALAADNATLDLTEASAQANAAKVDAEARRIQETRRQMRASCCASWLLGLGVIVVFMLTILFIRLVPAPPRRR